MSIRNRLNKLEMARHDARGCDACEGTAIVIVGEGENLPADLPACRNPQHCLRIVIEEVIVSTRADAKDRV